MMFLSFFLLLYPLFCFTEENRIPPLKETVFSQNGNYKVSVTAIYDEKSGHFWVRPISSIELQQKDKNGKFNILFKSITQNLFRPKLFAVNNSGYVLTLDDWDNSPSPRAVMIYNKIGEIILEKSFDDLINEFEVSEKTMLDNSVCCKSWWIAEKNIRVNGDSFYIKAGGGEFIIKPFENKYKIEFK